MSMPSSDSADFALSSPTLASNNEPTASHDLVNPDQDKPSPTTVTDKASSDNDSLLTQIHQQLMTEEERQAYHDKVKAESYMRWLAFYYLGRREHSKQELKDKLLAKECDADAVALLIEEFAEQGYQSDERMTSALIKDGISKGHGHQRIWQDMKKRGLRTLKSAKGIDEWIDDHTDFFTDLLANEQKNTVMASSNTNQAVTSMGSSTLIDEAVVEVDWLALAVQARVKKYGDSVPITPKDKAKQLRFLQYRGFSMSVCFDALNYTLQSLDERE